MSLRSSSYTLILFLWFLIILFLYFNSKSISRLNVEGLIDINLSPFEYIISYQLPIFITDHKDNYKCKKC